MSPRSLSDRVEILINDLIEEGRLDSASLASILVVAQDSVNQGYCLELSRQVWLVADALRSRGGDSHTGAMGRGALAGSTADSGLEES
jgi:hypothetical protein